jgi:hypothetical protein
MHLQGAEAMIVHTEGAGAPVCLGYYGSGLRPVGPVVTAELSFGHFTMGMVKVIVSYYRNRYSS